MLEVTIFDIDGNLEIGTFDYESSLIEVGNTIDGMLITHVELNPSTGEDAIITIEFV